MSDDCYCGSLFGAEICEPCQTLLYDSHSQLDQAKEKIDRLRGQLQNCVNYLSKANRGSGRSGDWDAPIASANKALYETL